MLKIYLFGTSLWQKKKCVWEKKKKKTNQSRGIKTLKHSIFQNLVIRFYANINEQLDTFIKFTFH